MTRKLFRNNVIGVASIYLVIGVVFVGLYTGLPGKLKDNDIYNLFKDITPFIVAIPAAYLGFCFQRRLSFLQSLKTLWGNLLDAVQSAIYYTRKADTKQEEHWEVLRKLSKVIDEVRGVYRNEHETDRDPGIYVFESLKSIYEKIDSLGYGTLPPDTRQVTRDAVVEDWKKLRKTFLREFDRSAPTYIDSPFVEY